ncbi:MAG: transposase family protein [Actinobacteria bacterium]|nr:transposase family protein [Actinomycetota bacterium]
MKNAHAWLVDPNRQQRNQATPPPSPRKQVQIRLDENQELAVIAAYRSGFTVYEVGAKFGIHRTTVSAIMQRHGVKLRRAPKRPYRVHRSD